MSDAIVKMGYSDAELQAGLRRSAAHTKTFAAQTQAAFTGLSATLRSSLAGALGAAGIGLGFSGLKGLFDQYDRIAKLGIQTGFDPESMQRIGAAAKLAGSDVETVAKAMNKLNRAIAEGGAADAFQELGISIDAFQNASGYDRFVMLAKAFQDAEKHGRGLSAAYDLMSKSAAELLPLLRSDIAELESFRNIDVVSAAQIQDIQTLNDEFDKLVQTLEVKLMRASINAEKGLSQIGAGLREWLSSMQGSFWEGVEKERTKQAIADADSEFAAKRRKPPIQPGEKESTEDKAATSRLAKQRESLTTYQEDLALLRARVSGNEELAKKMEREITLRRDALRIQQETGASEKDALALARQKQDLEDKLAKHHSRIRGYSKAQRDAHGKGWGLDFERSRPSALDGFRDLQKEITLPNGGTARLHPAFANGANTSLEVMSRRSARAMGALGYATERTAQQDNRTIEQILRSIADNTAPMKDL